ncbi:hypothetical protein KKH39_04920 [Patescibacteria group bacterium]|nr:hypothetical protein [Patescibacteria group bacterium]
MPGKILLVQLNPSKEGNAMLVLAYCLCKQAPRAAAKVSYLMLCTMVGPTLILLSAMIAGMIYSLHL